MYHYSFISGKNESVVIIDSSFNMLLTQNASCKPAIHTDDLPNSPSAFISSSLYYNLLMMLHTFYQTR